MNGGVPLLLESDKGAGDLFQRFRVPLIHQRESRVNPPAAGVCFSTIVAESLEAPLGVRLTKRVRR